MFFHHVQRLPTKFVKDHEDDLSSIVTLSDPNLKEWKIGLEKYEDDVWFNEGWEKFVEHYSITKENILVFKYEGDSRFHVVIFDMSGSEIQYPPTHDPDSNVGFEKDHVISLDLDDDEDFSLGEEHYKKGLTPTRGKRKRRKIDISPTLIRKSPRFSKENVVIDLEEPNSLGKKLLSKENHLKVTFDEEKEPKKEVTKPHNPLNSTFSVPLSSDKDKVNEDSSRDNLQELDYQKIVAAKIVSLETRMIESNRLLRDIINNNKAYLEFGEAKAKEEAKRFDKLFNALCNIMNFLPKLLPPRFSFGSSFGPSHPHSPSPKRGEM